jgi:hypothetical protein
MASSSRKTSGDKQWGNTSNPRSPRFNDVKFVQYELDVVQQKACKDHVVSPDEIFDSLLALCSDGYSVSVKYDGYSRAYAAFMQQRTEGGRNFGLILTGRGSSPFKAVKQLLYKHSVCLDGDWGEYVERDGPVVYDD